jgi:ATP-dependent RNA helicase DeaD
LQQVERLTKAKIEFKRLPTASDVNERRREALKGMVTKVLTDGTEYSDYLGAVRDLAEDHDPLDIAAALLKLYADETGRATTEEQRADDVATFGGSHSRGGETGMTRLFINLGRNFRVRPQDIVGAIANEADVPGRSIGAIDILESYTFVDVPTDAAEHVVNVLNSSTIKGRPVNVEISKEPAGEMRGGDRGPRAGGGGYRGGQRRDDRSSRPGTGFRAERNGRFASRRDEEGRGPGGRNFGGGAPRDDRRGPRRP